MIAMRSAYSFCHKKRQPSPTCHQWSSAAGLSLIKSKRHCAMSTRAYAMLAPPFAWTYHAPCTNAATRNIKKRHFRLRKVPPKHEQSGTFLPWSASLPIVMEGVVIAKKYCCPLKLKNRTSGRIFFLF